MKVKLKPWDEAVQVGKRDNWYDVCVGVECVYGFSENELPWGEYIDVDCTEWGDLMLGRLTRIPNHLFDYDEADILHYGDIITDDVIDGEDYIRIRLISYGGLVWYHKMVDGLVVECRKVGRLNG